MRLLKYYYLNSNLLDIVKYPLIYKVKIMDAHVRKRKIAAAMMKKEQLGENVKMAE